MNLLSLNEDYNNYVFFISNNEFKSAEEAIKKCIKNIEVSDQVDFDQLSYLYQCLGNVLYSNGDLKKALNFYKTSIEVANFSLLSLLQFSKFLAGCNKYKPAIENCNKIIEMATKNPYPESETDFSSEYYLNKARELKQQYEIDLLR